MLKSKIESFLSFLQNKTLLITSHELVDLDGAASSIALNFFLHSLIDDLTTHLYFSGISKNTELFLETFKRKFPTFKYELKNSLENLDVDA